MGVVCFSVLHFSYYELHCFDLSPNCTELYIFVHYQLGPFRLQESMAALLILYILDTILPQCQFESSTTKYNILMDSILGNDDIVQLLVLLVMEIKYNLIIKIVELLYIYVMIVQDIDIVQIYNFTHNKTCCNSLICTCNCHPVLSRYFVHLLGKGCAKILWINVIQECIVQLNLHSSQNHIFVYCN